MTSDVLETLLRVNLVGGAAILAVIALRRPMRALFGPETAYKLWAAPPIAAIATLMPARVVDHATERMDLAPGAWSAALLALWIVGGLAVAAGLWRAQAAFLAEAKAGRAGPSVVGVISPRILLPADDGRFTDEERRLIRAHERQHIERMDPRAGALAAAFQCLCWFNPLAHLAAHLLRLDQELATDAAVLRRHPRERALYAKTLLKTQLAGQPLPFGCYWPARGAHPLEVRIGLMKSQRRVDDGIAGPLIVAAGVAAAAIAAYAAKPPMPRPQPIVELFERHQAGPTMSVVLVQAPPPAAPAD